jgi:hypothetical protein
VYAVLASEPDFINELRDLMRPVTLPFTVEAYN